MFQKQTLFLENLAKIHYENFPVGSWLIPRRYREPIHLIYTFARVADDFADEGNRTAAERISRIDEWQKQLHDAVKGEEKNDDIFFKQLAGTIHTYHLPLHLFDDLLIAFRKDATNPLYSTFDMLLEYCRYSANPIGRLLLQIFECSNETTNPLSDALCTALQLTNFWQDISVDTRRNRFYIPQTDLQKFGILLSDLHSENNKEAVRLLMKHYIKQTRELFNTAKPLFNFIPSDFRIELKLIWHGGMRILEKIEAMHFDTRRQCPTITLYDKLLIAARALKHY